MGRPAEALVEQYPGSHESVVGLDVWSIAECEVGEVPDDAAPAVGLVVDVCGEVVDGLVMLCLHVGTCWKLMFSQVL